ncbi:TPA: DUF763 domain-containing protein [bacterium]|nr:DUF763 domain-containing protein [bacterium]
MKTGVANLPLHYGECPKWLFSKMKELSGWIIEWIVQEFGEDGFLEKTSDPFWFQAFGCCLGFDWHSSGLTTTVCGAVKEGIKDRNLGIWVCGGKGKVSRKTPDEIKETGGRFSIPVDTLIYASRLSAKVDTTALQDGYQLYHHTFIFTKNKWAVIQQGMNTETRLARRYHWLSYPGINFVSEPHKAICCNRKGNVLNMVAFESKDAREISTITSKEKPDIIMNEIERLKTLNLPKHHQIFLSGIDKKRLKTILLKTYEKKPNDFEGLLAINGVGPKTMRALSLISELIYGKPPSYKDPVRFSFSHGGKDGYPYPIDRDGYERSIEILKDAISHAKIGDYEKMRVIKRLGLLV